MGLAAAGAVIVAVLIALTLVPALMTADGPAPGERPHRAPESSFGARWVTRHPLLAILAVLGAIAIPTTDMRLGLPDDSTAPAGSTERRSYDLLTEGFGPGFTGPLTIVTEIPPDKPDPEQIHKRVAEALRLNDVGVALLLMALVFRSLLVPIKAALGFLLTIAAALGIVNWVFQEGHLGSVFGIESTSPIISFLPVLMIAILFGLAMDYEVFLVSPMRESYTHSPEALQSTVDGFAASARVVTAAALIMIAVFGGFILGDDLVVKSIGFALAFGVLADAFLVASPGRTATARTPSSAPGVGGPDGGSRRGSRASRPRSWVR